MRNKKIVSVIKGRKLYPTQDDIDEQEDKEWKEQMAVKREALIQRRLEEIRKVARARHEEARKAALQRGRKYFPLLPYECSWAFEMEYRRKEGNI